MTSKLMSEQLKLTSEGAILLASPTDWPLPITGTLAWEVEVQQSTLPPTIGARQVVSSKGLIPTREELAHGSRFTYARLGEKEPFINMHLVIEVQRRGENLCCSATINNNDAAWMVRTFTFPLLDGIATGNASLLWPHGLGQRFKNLSTFGCRRLMYPSCLATMPWFALAEANGGLYLGSHDPAMSARTIEATYTPATQSLSIGITHLPFCAPAQSWAAPEFILASYQGSWETAAHRYRSWYETVAKLSQPSAWAQNSTGWLLAILKQQNGDVMWDYRIGIDHLCDIAETLGLDTIGLFGWAHGGHDSLYPDYIPDPLLGGAQALKTALARTRQRGIRTILYANGMIMDTSTDFYRYQGNDAILHTETSEPSLHAIRKFFSATPVTFAMACPGAETWRRQMRTLAEQANALGADGILFDQLGVYPPMNCFANNHRHATPATAFTIERASMIQDIATWMQTRNPDFIIMTEGIYDTLLNGISYAHGWGCGFATTEARHHMFDSEGSFPSLFRVTFPELPMTQRYPNPVLDRHQANFAAVHGLRHELEIRYQADVRYLTTGQLPTSADYAENVFPPDIDLLRQTDPTSARDYLRTLTIFERRYAAFLWQGRFLAQQGFTLDNASLLANAYLAGNQLAVCVWNPTDIAQACPLSVPEYTMTECSEPEMLVADSESHLPAETIRLYLFERDNE